MVKNKWEEGLDGIDIDLAGFYGELKWYGVMEYKLGLVIFFLGGFK